jgi:hypothetical protein
MRRRRQTGSTASKFGLIALHVADVIIGLSIISTDRREVANAIYALLKRSLVTLSIESLLNLLASDFTFINIIATIDTANWLVDELTVASILAGLGGEESGPGTFHDTRILIAGSVSCANNILSVSTLASLVRSNLVVKVIARSDLNSSGTVAFGTAQIGIGDTIASTNRIVVGIATASIRKNRRAKSQKSSGLIFSERVNRLRGRCSRSIVVSQTPAVVGLVNSSKVQEAFVLVSLAIHAAYGAVDDGTAGLGGEVVGLGGESGHVDQGTDAVVSNWDSFELTMNEHGGRRSDQKGQDERSGSLHCWFIIFKIWLVKGNF